MNDKINRIVMSIKGGEFPFHLEAFREGSEEVAIYADGVELKGALERIASLSGEPIEDLVKLVQFVACVHPTLGIVTDVYGIVVCKNCGQVGRVAGPTFESIVWTNKRIPLEVVAKYGRKV